jgi:hypothetical protein
MDINRPPASSAPNIPPPPPGVFGTKIPSGVTFAICVLLFFLPFAEVKCNGSLFANNSGFGIASGKEWKTNRGMFGNDLGDSRTENQKNDPNVYAIIALTLGVIGLGLSLTNAKAAIGGAVISGVLSAGALVGLIFDLKKQVKGSIPVKTGGELGNRINDIKVTVEFTPWFYIAIIGFLTAAFFCYQRMRTMKK